MSLLQGQLQVAWARGAHNAAGKGAHGRTCHTRETLRLAGCAQTPCWNSSRARARLPARASSMPQACTQQLSRVSEWKVKCLLAAKTS